MTVKQWFASVKCMISERLPDVEICDVDEKTRTFARRDRVVVIYAHTTSTATFAVSQSAGSRPLQGKIPVTHLEPRGIAIDELTISEMALAIETALV